MKSKIALLIDSGCDVPDSYLALPNVFLIPLHIVKDGVVYTDKVDITSEEVYDQLPYHDFKTSLPSGHDIVTVIDQIVAEGYKEVLVVTISSGLSGTHNITSLICQDYDQLTFRIVDTLNIAMGAGLSAIQAIQFIDEGQSLDEIADKLLATRSEKKIFFCIGTLEYLRKGGRIGKVSALIGGLIDLKPIITCDKEGVYATVAKVRSRKLSLQKTLELVATEAKKYTNVKIAYAFSKKDEEVEQLKAKILETITNCVDFIEGQIGPAMVVHTGPGLVGIAVHPIESSKNE